jgi:hypothetical protein
MVNIATMCNATIHRYLFVSDFAGDKQHRLPKIFVNTFMVFLQIIWPLVAATLLLKIDFHPSATIEENKNVNFL